MFGYGALGEFALGEGPSSATATRSQFPKFSHPVRKAGLAAAVVATTFVGFVPPPPANAAKVFSQFSVPAKKVVQREGWRFSPRPPVTQTAVFTRFSQPLASKVILPDEQPSALFEVRPPLAPPFTGFAEFARPFKPANIAVEFGNFQTEITFVPPPDTHDLVFMGDQFRKKKRRDLIDEEVSRKAKLRGDLELAIYGPEVSYAPPGAAVPEPVPPPNVDDLAKVILQARLADHEAQRKALEQDDEDVIEMMLKDL